MSNFTVLIDLDSTVYDLLTPWLEWYNRNYNDSLRLQDIDRWSWHEICKPECGTKLYSFLNKKGLFSSLKPFDGALEAIREVHALGIKQVFCSTIVGTTGAREKEDAIIRDFPFLGKASLVLVGKDKDLVKGDVLVDDGPHNLKNFSGFKVLARLQDTKYCYEYDYKIDDILLTWSDYPEIIQNLKGSD